MKRQTCQSHGLMCKQHGSLPPLCASHGICQQLVCIGWGWDGGLGVFWTMNELPEDVQQVVCALEFPMEKSGTGHNYFHDTCSNSILNLTLICLSLPQVIPTSLALWGLVQPSKGQCENFPRKQTEEMHGIGTLLVPKLQRAGVHGCRTRLVSLRWHSEKQGDPSNYVLCPFFGALSPFPALNLPSHLGT